MQCYCLISQRLIWEGRPVKEHRKRNRWGLLHPSCITTLVSVCTVSRILFHVWRCVCCSEISCWKPKLLGLLRSSLQDLKGNLECTAWPWLHTALFRGKITFSCVCCMQPLAFFTKATLVFVLFSVLETEPRPCTCLASAVPLSCIPLVSETGSSY
jgi:hypothetical protein